MYKKQNSRRVFLKQSVALIAAAGIEPVLRAGTEEMPDHKGLPEQLPDIDEEITRTRSDFIVYVPKSTDGSTADTGNEHFLVFPGPDGSLMAVWTQSTVEGHRDHRIMFSKSIDKGRTWADPKFLVGVKAGQGDKISIPTSMWPGKWEMPPERGLRQASWGYPLLSKSGRIYIVFNQFQGIVDVHYEMTGTMDAIYSDDYGLTWSKPQTIPMKRSIWDHPDPSKHPNWIVWQRPQPDLKGSWFTGFTRWISPAVRHSSEGVDRWFRPEAVIEFMKYENIDDDPEPKDIRISWFASDHRALRVPHFDQPALSIAEEPSIVRLPDNRLFCTMRTTTHYIWYSISDDDGEKWSAPQPLLYHDHGKPIISPVFCTPVYRLSDGRYILIHHPAYKTPDLRKKYNVPSGGESFGYVLNRRPAFIALGEYRPTSQQPIWFSKSKLFMDNDGVPLGPRGRVDTGGYGSLTSLDGENVFWHPDRKFFLLGKIITKEFLADMKVPETI